MDEQSVEPPKRSRLENFLSGCLAFVILICVPIILIGLSANRSEEYDPVKALSIRNQPRQKALERNWNQFLDRAEWYGRTIQKNKFELTFCPFEEDGNWEEDISPEEAGMICGYVSVPLFHEDPQGQTIQVPVVLWPYSNIYANPDPLVITHGGPGGSALEMYPAMLYPDRIGGNRDILIIDQRGTRFAEPNLICPEVTESIYGAADPNDEHEYDYQGYLSYCRARLAGDEISLAAFTTPQIARDFEVVRKVFGYDQVNFYGVSYGTHVGQYLAAYFPESIRSIILDGVAPIPLDYLNRMVSTRTRIVDEIVSHCSQDPSCVRDYPNLEERLSNLINRLDQNPETVRLGLRYRFYPIELDGEYFYNYIFSIAYMDQNYSVLPYIIKEAEHNRFDLFKAWIDWRISDISQNSLSYYSVICSEHQPFQQTANEGSSISYPLISWENQDLDEMNQICRRLGIQPERNTLQELPEITAPALLLSGKFDPITPPEFGEQALKSFPNGQHLIEPFGSHGVAFDRDCIDSIMNQFLQNPHGNLQDDCLLDPDRQQDVVPPSALSSLFMRNDLEFSIITVLLAGCMILVLIPRYGLQGIQWVWKKIRKTHRPLLKPKKRIIIRFELTNWVFLLCSIGLSFGLDQFDTALRRPSIYRYALALPEDARYIMIIPLILIILTPFLIYFSIRVWSVYSSVLARVYLLLNSILFLSISGIIAFNDMLLTWTR